MEDKPSKGRGRPRKTLDVPNAAAEGESASANNPGNGETGSAGHGQEADHSRAAWIQFVGKIQAVMNSSGAGYVSEAFYPGGGPDIEGPYTVQVSDGDPGYKTPYNQVFSI